MKFINQTRLNTLDLPVHVRRKMWNMPFIRSYLVVFLSYLCMYLIRKNFNVSQNDLIEKYGFTKTQLGSIGFWFSITYGVGKTLVGYVGDGKNTKNFISMLLILASVCMMMFGFFLGNLPLMIFFFAINGFFQSAGGPLSYSTITKWTPKKSRGTFLGLWNMSHNAGGALAAVVATYGAEKIFNGDVKGMFLFPAFIALVMGIIGFFTGSDSPEAYGLGTAEEIFEEKLSIEDEDHLKSALSKWDTFKKFILKNPFIWILCIANVFVYVVRIGVDQWSVVYAKEVLGLSKEIAKAGFTMFELGALSGALIWGGASDFLKGRRALLSMLAFLLILFVLNIYQTASNEETFKWSMFALGFLIFGPQLLVCVSAVGFVPKSAVSVSNGMLGTFAYILGDSFAKLGLGMMADKKEVFGLSGWEGTFIVMKTSAILGILVLFFVAIAEEKKIKARN